MAKNYYTCFGVKNVHECLVERVITYSLFSTKNASLVEDEDAIFIISAFLPKILIIAKKLLHLVIIVHASNLHVLSGRP